MFDWDEDVFDNPSAVEEVILKAKADIEDLFSAEVKQTIEDAAGAKAQLEQLQQKIRSAEYRLGVLQKQVEDAEKRAEQAELYDVPAKYIAKFVRNATGDLAPGDEVWVIVGDGKWENCPTCNGRKKITAQFGGKDVEVKCPECDGNGRKYKKRSKVEKRTVDSVHLKLCFRSNRVSYWNTENVYLFGRDSAIDPKFIYRSEEEALAHIAKEG